MNEPTPTLPKCFISYSWDSEAHKQWVRDLADSLRRRMIQVSYDQDRQQNRLGQSITKFIEDGIASADVVLFICTAEYVQKANDRKGGVGFEFEMLAGKLCGNSNPQYIPIRRGCSALPDCIAHLHAIDMSDDRTIPQTTNELATDICGALNSPDGAMPSGRPTSVRRATDAYFKAAFKRGDGIAPHDVVFGKEALIGEVFTVELLTMPIHLTKADGRTIVTVNRGNVEWAVYNCKGRDLIPKLMFPDKERVNEALALDKQIAAFIAAGEEGTEFPIHQEHMRWASGAVLPIVKFKRRRWVPFFFREIAPYGWQLPQGHSERRDDLDKPWTFIMREFLEEVLVCSERRGTAHTIAHPFYFENMDIKSQIDYAKTLSHHHQELRYERDSMALCQGDPVSVSFAPTAIKLWVHDGVKKPRENSDVLVLFNITELGIEVIKVITFDLQDDQYILGGEILEPYGEESHVELLRAPVALISLDYLRRAFGRATEYKYAFEHDTQLPSILGPTIRSDEIHFFPHDLLRRWKIARSEENAPRTTAWETKSYREWLEMFGPYFFDIQGDITNENPCRLFTATAAKVFAQYFENTD